MKRLFLWVCVLLVQEVNGGNAGGSPPPFKDYTLSFAPTCQYPGRGP